MQITSTTFAVFVTLVWIGYWSGSRLLEKNRPQAAVAWRVGWLVAACLIFILSWSHGFLISLLTISLANYMFGLLLGNGNSRRNFLLWVGICLNLAALVGFKYEDFFVPALRKFLQIDAAYFNSLQFIMPVGLSFITVQMISYLVDVHRRQVKPETNVFKFTLYTLYFPKIISGPIERARTFLPKVENAKNLSEQEFKNGLGQVAVGLVRKTLLANSIYALLPADLFTQPLNYPAQLLVLWLAAYAYFLYNDFAGYSSLARGISALFGIELSLNFNTPYFAQNFSDFWNRWHISLSAWLRDYIYFPVARALRTRIPNSENKIHILLPPIITMAVSGLWHGFSWNMLLWGGLHGIYQVLERLLNFNPPRISPGFKPTRRQRLAGVVVFVFVCLAWIPFRMDLLTARRYLAGMILPSHWLAPDFYWLGLILSGREPMVDLSALNFPDPRLIFLLCLAYWLDRAQAKWNTELFFLRWKPWILAAAAVLVVTAVFLLSFADTAPPFVYQGF